MDYDREWRPRNFRDVGETLKSLGNAAIKNKMLFRGGEFDVLCLSAQHECIAFSKTIINIRAQADREDTFHPTPVQYFHLPTKNGPRDYETSDKKIKGWVREVITLVCSMKEESYPLFIHCRSGKDRTGIIIGIILLILGVPLENIVQEYLTSKEGKISEEAIRHALRPYTNAPFLQREFKKCNLTNLRRILTDTQ